MTLDNPPPLAPAPFVEHRFEYEFEVPFARGEVWDWLNDPETFTRGQIWPYFVEFVGGGFEPGVLCNHHGPGIHFPGVIGEVRAPEYRDLQYCYGAYALTPRWIRPARLEFWLDEAGENGTRVRLRLESWVKPSWRGLWNWGQTRFWRLFRGLCRRGVKARLRQAASRESSKPESSG